MSGLCDGGLLRSSGHNGFGRRNRCFRHGFRCSGLLGGDGSGSRNGSRCRGLRLLLHRRRGWFGEKTSPPLLSALGDHAALGVFHRFPIAFNCGVCGGFFRLGCS